MQLKLPLDGLEVGYRIGAIERLEIEHVHEQSGPLHVRKEVVAEPGAGARALDQPRDVGDHELPIAELERAERRLERGERIAGDLRMGARQAGEQRGLSRVRQPDETRVGEQLQLQRDPALAAGQAAFGESWRLVRGAGEALVAAPTRAAASDHCALTGPHQIVPRPIRFH